MHKTPAYGFTLLEIIIVISLIGLISTFFLGNVFSSLARGRDSRRKQDLRSVAQGLELYYNDNRVYPTALPTPGQAFSHPQDINVIYLSKIPADPVSAQNYCYSSSTGISYKFYASLENPKDLDIIPTITCSGKNYNYGISSPNTTP